MISNFGRYIPIIFLVICVFVFLDSLISFSQLQEIQREERVIAQTFRQVYERVNITISQVEENTIQYHISSFSSTTNRMYVIIVLSATLNLLLVVFAYVAIMRELRQRTHLERNKDEFISLTSHELRTPITTINIFSEMLSRKIGTLGDKQTKHILFKMQSQIEEMKDLINDLLDVTRIQLGKFELQKENFNCTQMLEDTIEDIQTTTKKHTISLSSPKNVSIYADKQRIWQVVANLLNNAVKYSPNGGKIQVRLQREPTAIIVSVKDTGIGINKENQSKIFQRYFREVGNSEKDYSGLGVGLYLALQIVQLHNGKIWVKSTPGKGSTFYFSLPRKKIV